MVENDSNATRTLSRSDFARFIDKFAKKAHTDFHSVADFMIMLAVTEDDPSEEIALLVGPFSSCSFLCTESERVEHVLEKPIQNVSALPLPPIGLQL